MMIEYHLNEHEWGRIEREKGKHVHYYSRHHVLLGESSLGWSFAVATLSLVFFTLHLSARPSLFFYFFTVKHYLIFILRVLPLCLSLCFEEMCRTRDRNRSSPIGNFLRPFCQKDYVECNSIVEIELFFFLYFLVQNVCRFWFDAPSSGCRRLDDESSVTRALSSSFFFSSCSVGKPHLSRRTRPSIIIDREITCERSAARKCFDGKDITYARNGSSLLSVSIRLVKLLSSSHFFFFLLLVLDSHGSPLLCLSFPSPSWEWQTATRSF